MTLLGAADALAEAVVVDELPVADADGAELLRLATIAAASLGETVDVLTNELAWVEFEFESEEVELDEPEFDEVELDEVELDDEEPLPLPFLRMRVAIMSTSMSIKVSSGPATIALLCRSMTPPFKG